MSGPDTGLLPIPIRRSDPVNPDAPRRFITEQRLNALLALSDAVADFRRAPAVERGHCFQKILDLQEKLERAL